MLIVLVVASHIEQLVVGGASHDGVDVSIGVVAGKDAVVEPYHTLGMEPPQQLPFYLVAVHGLVAVGCQEAAAGGEDGAATVAFHRTALQDEVVMVFQGVGEEPGECQAAADGIVEFGRELAAPSVEFEVEQTGMLPAAEYLQGERAVVACPCVVGGALEERHPPHGFGGQPCREDVVRGFGVGCDDEQRLVACDGFRHLDECLGDFVQTIGPVGAGMGPCELDEALRLPFRGKVQVVHGGGCC